MVNAVIYLSGLVVLFSLLYVARLAAKPTEGMILGVMLPREHYENPLVTELTKRYNNVFLGVTAALALILLPAVILLDRTSLIMIAVLVWIGVTMWASNHVFTTFHDKLVTIKKENGWRIESSTLLTIDMELSRIKGQLSVSPWWFVPPFFLVPLPLLLGRLMKAPLEFGAILAGISLFCFVLFFICYQIEKRQPVKTISEDTSVNLAYNRARKRVVSALFVQMSWVMGLGLSAFSLSMREYSFNIPLFTFSVIGLTLASILVSISPTRTLRRERSKLDALAVAPVYQDEGDDVWRHGLLYYSNPKNPRILTNRRIGGYGHTVNMGTHKGKILTGSIIGGTVLLTGIIAVMMLWFDFGDMGLTEENGSFTARGAMYSATFSGEDIESVSLVDEIPSGMRTNGVADKRILLGHFSIPQYGKAQLFVHRQSAPYIAIKLQDGYVFLNGETKEQTQEYFDLLSSRVTP